MCTGISFTPREVGEHVVSVKKMGKHITNSPFKIKVGEREVGDAKKVKVTGNSLQEGKTHVENTFKVDTKNAGKIYFVMLLYSTEKKLHNTNFVMSINRCHRFIITYIWLDKRCIGAKATVFVTMKINPTGVLYCVLCSSTAIVLTIVEWFLAIYHAFRTWPCYSTLSAMFTTKLSTLSFICIGTVHTQF